MNFNQQTFDNIFHAECIENGIGPGLQPVSTAVQNIIDDLDAANQTETQTKLQMQVIMNKINALTTRDLYVYCLNDYYLRNMIYNTPVSDSFFTSGFERTTAVFDGKECRAPYDSQVPLEYIQSDFFQCIFKFLHTKGYRINDIYSLMIRFGCIVNPSANMLVKLFNNFKSPLNPGEEYYLQEGNVDSMAKIVNKDRNIFTTNQQAKKKFTLSTEIFYKITYKKNRVMVSDEPFSLVINYGDLSSLTNNPYRNIFSMLLYKRDMIIYKEQKQQKQAATDKWLTARNETPDFFRPGGGNKRKKNYKSRKNGNGHRRLMNHKTKSRKNKKKLRRN